jgi:3-hydroxyisobutyrate dehydrogenase-like beta-hydroxyacid dehydrogenase
MTLRTGFVGLGLIGNRMSRRLTEAGLETTVYDLLPGPVQELVATGAKAASSPREVAAASDVVGVCVQTDAQVRSVVEGENGLLAGAKPGLVIAIHSTVLPATVEAVHAAAAPRGVAVVDACVTGVPRAPEPNFKLFLAGDPAAIAKIEPYTSAIAVRTIQAGALGNSCKVKICLNLVTYLQWTAAFEAAALAKGVGLPLEVLEEVGRANGQITDMMIQYLALHKAPEPVRKSNDMQTYLRTNMHVAEKDLAHALALAREAGVALPGAALVSQLMARIYLVDDAARR